MYPYDYGDAGEGLTGKNKKVIKIIASVLVVSVFVIINPAFADEAIGTIALGAADAAAKNTTKVAKVGVWTRLTALDAGACNHLWNCIKKATNTTAAAAQSNPRATGIAVCLIMTGYCARSIIERTVKAAAGVP